MHDFGLLSIKDSLRLYNMDILRLLLHAGKGLTCTGTFEKPVQTVDIKGEGGIMSSVYQVFEGSFDLDRLLISPAGTSFPGVTSGRGFSMSYGGFGLRHRSVERSEDGCHQ
jgi:hypothetical protein